MRSFNGSNSSGGGRGSAKPWLASLRTLSLPARLTVAALAVSLALLAQRSVAARTDAAPDYAFLYPAVAASAALGFPPAVFSVGLLAAFIQLFAQPADQRQIVDFILFVGSGLFLAAICDAPWRAFSELTRRKDADAQDVYDRHFQLAVSAGAIGAWDIDLAAKAATVVGDVHTIYGLPPDAPVTVEMVARLVIEEDAETFRRMRRAALDPSRGGAFFAQYRIRRPSDQAVRCIASWGHTLFEYGKAVRVVGVSRDITDEKSAARALLDRAQISEQLASVAVAAPGVVGSFYIGASGRVVYRYVSPKARVVFGVEAADICADAGHFFRRLSKEDLDRLNDGLFRSARDMSLWVVEFRFQHPIKGQIWLEAQAAPVREASGLVVWHGYASDVTARKRSELSVAESAARLQATIDGARDAVLTMDADGRIQSVNKAGALMFGYEPHEMIGLCADRLFEPPEASDDGDCEGFAIAKERVGERWELRGRRSDRTPFPAELSLSEARTDDQRLLVAFVKDLSLQRKIEQRVEQLRRDRLDAMGGMTATLAHEINQPLAATATYLKVARRLLEKAQRGESVNVMEVLEKATAQTLRAGRIVTSLRDLVQRGEPDKTLVRLHDLVHEAYDLVKAETALSEADIRLACEATDDRVIADRTQLRQVLGNLMRNAVEAMQSMERRELVVATSNPDGSSIRVDVIDTGCGLGESGDRDFFEAFTSTKTKGMGIGLSISRSIIEDHYGRIWAQPNSGGGAVFSFTLPLQDADIDT